MPQTSAIKPVNKRQLLTNIATASELSRKQVADLLEALVAEVNKNLSNDGPGVISVQGWMKIERKTFVARPARTGVPDPFKPGEVRDIAAKPAYGKIKVRTLKLLMEMAKS